MFSLKFVLIAILICLGCALAQSLQADAVVSEVAESGLEVKDEAERWRWHEENQENEAEVDEVAVEVEERSVEPVVVENKKRTFLTPCSAPKPTTKPSTAPTSRPPTAPTTRPTSEPTSAPTQRPTSAPTQKATQKPTSAPTQKATSAPTQKATSAPTQKATSAPTQKATSAPTQRPTSAPTQKATSAPTQKATSAPTQKATSAPTQKATSAPTQRPTSAPTQKATSAPTQKATSAPTQKPTNAPSTSGGNSNYGLCDIVPTSVEPMKMLLPLYVYPGSTWDQIVSAASKIDIIAIVNPNSGPGSAITSAYSTYMNKLNTAGVEQVGYVYTQYGTRSIATVKADIDIYVRSFPHVTGIFFDEASNSAADIPYYRELYNYIIAKGYRHSILNPGVTPAQGYLDISTNIVVFEDYGSSVASKSYSSFVKCAPSASQKAGYKYKFSGIAHTATLSNVGSFIEKFHNSGLGLVYVTDGAGGCCTYNNMPSFFSSEVTAIQSFN